MSHENDPLLRYGRALAGVLIAVVISVLIAAVIGGSLPLDYVGRACVYTGLVAYVVAGGKGTGSCACAFTQLPQMWTAHHDG